MRRYTLEDERSSHSEFGAVKDEEYLLRVVYAPEHIKEGLVIEASISLDDLKSKGFSLDREMYVDNALMQQRISIQTERNPDMRQSSSISKFRCSDAREILDQANERAFIVIDDAIVENKAHASLYSAKEGLGKGTLRKLRSLLLPLLQQN